MAFDSRVYRILIASPSDVAEEREIAVRVIQEWNDLHSFTRKVVLLPLRWETHTAPEYGIRPQEAINRAIVDECDLLLGLFWTRIGTPTGEAKSGTLEEISRVAMAGKPVLLYFSKVGAEPDEIDLDQMKRLRAFKKETYPNALVESYKSAMDFHDKFAKQLEMKVRDLQKHDNSVLNPLDFSFVSQKTGETVGETQELEVTIPKVCDEETIEKEYEKKKDRIHFLIAERVVERSAVPVLLSVGNLTSSGIRNVYVEIRIQSLDSNARILKNLRGGSYYGWDFFAQEESGELAESLSKIESEGLVEDEGGWKLTIEWGAIQPQRRRLIKPIVFVIPQKSTTIEFTAKVYADSFAEPIELKSNLKLQTTYVEASWKDLIDLKSLEDTTSSVSASSITYPLF